MKKIESRLPESCGKVKLCPEELCLHVYMPVRLPWSQEGLEDTWMLPHHLEWVRPLLGKIDLGRFEYAYITVKHSYVSGYQNRDGWHIDGFGGEDINYIWSNVYPTEVCVGDFELSDCHDKSIKEMEEQAEHGESVTLSEGCLYRLDTSVVHRSPLIDKPVLRTFVKVSLSNEVYNLIGNATNPEIDARTNIFKPTEPRECSRNHPVKYDCDKGADWVFNGF